MAWNIRQLQNRVANRPIMAVIKANAYGHGLAEVGRFLEKQGIKHLAVGNAAEAVRLRQAQSQATILNLGPFGPAEAQEIVRLGISQSIFSETADTLAEAARKAGRKAKVHIKIDTGLGRVGVPYPEAPAFIERIAARPEFEIEGVFTTLSEEADFDREQLSRFLQIVDTVEKKGIAVGIRHAASSAAILAEPQSLLDLVRPGISLYGLYPSTQEYKTQRIELRPVMTAKCRVILVKRLRPGEAAGYHRAFVATKDTLLVTLPVGYSDGYPHQAVGKGQVLIRGRRCPLVGLVTCNHALANVTEADGVAIGDEAVLMGRQGDQQIHAEELAEWTGSSVYKIVIGMNPTLPRLFLE